MSDEAEIRPCRESNASDGHAERAGEQSPLQGRVAFIKNWDWQFVTSFNQGACERGKAQLGHNPEAHGEIRQRWETLRTQTLTLGEPLDFLFQWHRAAPFLFFNGNTFGEIARRIVDGWILVGHKSQSKKSINRGRYRMGVTWKGRLIRARSMSEYLGTPPNDHFRLQCGCGPDADAGE